MRNRRLQLGFLAVVMTFGAGNDWFGVRAVADCRTEAVQQERVTGKDAGPKEVAKREKPPFRVFIDFAVDPMMSGWQNDGRQATSIQNLKDFKEFSAKVQGNPVYTNPRWKGDTPDKVLQKTLKEHEIDLAQEALVVLRYLTGPGEKVEAAPILENGVLTIKITEVGVAGRGPRPAIARLTPITVAVDRSKVDKVVFEYRGQESETVIR